MSSLRKKLLLLLANLFVASNYVLAQCAMCKASAETNSAAGDTQAHGINSAVLYVLVISFILLGGIAFILWKLRNADELNS